MESFKTSISYSRQLNSATNTKSPPIGRLSPRALSLVETFSLFAFSPSLRNGVVAVARTKTNQGESDVSKFETDRKKAEFRSDQEEKGLACPITGGARGAKALGRGEQRDTER